MRGSLLRLVLGLALAPSVACPAVGQTIRLEGGPVQLRLSTAPAGQHPPPVTDASTTLRFSERCSGSFKVTVSTVVSEQHYDLRVGALDPTVGTVQGEVALTDGMAPMDLLRDIELCDSGGGGPPPGRGRGPTFGRCSPGRGPPSCRGDATVQYRALIRATDGPGSDAHTVRYTILAQ